MAIEISHTHRMARTGLALAAVAALVLLVAVAGSLITDERQRQALPELAGNGLIAYSYEGDIYIGDPVTGETSPIVTDPEYEVNPVFSPDGTRIAFMRGDPDYDPSVLVVRADGSGERVVMRKGFSEAAGPFAWTPDGASLVIGHAGEAPFHVYLSLFDADGEAAPRRLTPPLPFSIGAGPFDPGAGIAPMFRPPAGDLILSNKGWDAVKVFDADLEPAGQLARQALGRYKPYFVEMLTWSPDAARIAFRLDLYNSPTDWLGSGIFVMDADGSDLRRVVGNGWDRHQWSPDASKLAYDRESNDPDQPPTGVIVITDLASGAERVLEATRAAQKNGARFDTVTDNMGHTWYHEGWSWAPDGRSLLVLENHRTRPWVVDIETDTVTKLPWLADSMPSWQRVTTG
jgi:dipeptidyl aminopeptidase/acylaminoacyl peptidase